MKHKRISRAEARILFFIAIFFAAAAVFAQHGVSLDAEIQKMEKAAAKGAAPERRDALVRLARLRQLSGDIEGAAKNWLEAAAAVPGDVDDNALLSCAYCLAAMGEWDRASKALEPLLSKSVQARFLDTSIKAIKSGDTDSLAALAETLEYSQMKSRIFFILWKTSKGAESEKWRQRLIAEESQSPEGLLAAGEKSSSVIVKPSPFWLLLGGQGEGSYLASVPSAKSEPTLEAKPAVSVNSAIMSVTETEKPAPQSVTETKPASAQVKLQTGLYGKEENAQAQIAKLKKAGFSPLLEQRGGMWAVVVPAGADSNLVIKELKDAGFDSFPVK